MKLFKNILCFISVLSLSIFLYSCKSDEHVHNFEKKITPATCYESGIVREVCSCGEMYISTTLPAKGHDYKYTYLYDGTHEQVCRNDSDHRDVVRCSFSSWVTTVEPGTYTEGKEERKCVCGNTQERAIPALHQHQYSSDFVIDVYATCTEDGLKSRHCVLGDCNSKIDETVIPKLDHSYGTPEYYWSSDFATVTAKAHCNNDYNHEISETVETTYNLIYNPTCTSEGLANYVSNEFNNKLFSVQSYSVSINPTDHSYEYLITWVDYNPIFVGVCKNDSSHTISKSDVVKSSYLLKESTCTQQGVIIHSAVYTYNGVEYNSTKEEILDSKGHSYICTFTWDEDKASVSIVCENDSSHFISGDAVVTSEIVTQPTCTQPGKIIYTATFDYKNNKYTDTKEEELPVVDHAYETYEILKNPNLQENGLSKVVCSYDETHVSEIELPKLSNTNYEAIENQEKTEINYTYKYQDLSINFVVKKFNLTLDVNNELYGSVSNSQKIYETDMTTIIATPNDDYKFFGWFDGDIMVSDSAEYSLVMPSKDYNLEARFTKGDYEIIAPETTNVWDGTIASGFAKGSGTPEDPFIITTGSELAYLAYAINNVLNNGQIYYAQGYYKLGNDIDLNNIEWTPIGIAFYDNGGAGSQDYSRVFMGTFDGDSHVINNLKISYLHKAFYRFNGLFGFNMGTIKNIGLENVNISVYAPSYYHYVGALAGYNQGNVTNVYSTGKVEGSAGDSQMYVGGLFGYATGTITNCYSTANISGTSQKYYAYAGGLVGECFAKVSNSFATGNITGGSGTRSFYGYTGGLVGKYSNENNFTNCYVYEGQVLTSSGYYNKNSLGISFNETDLNDSSFYFDTLKFDRESWSFENGKLILISNNANSKTFYQLFIEENVGGSVNLKEAILKYGASVKLIITENEGYEFAGWYSNGVLLSTDKEFIYTPSCSETLTLVFNTI